MPAQYFCMFVVTKWLRLEESDHDLAKNPFVHLDKVSILNPGENVVLEDKHNIHGHLSDVHQAQINLSHQKVAGSITIWGSEIVFQWLIWAWRTSNEYPWISPSSHIPNINTNFFFFDSEDDRR